MGLNVVFGMSEIAANDEWTRSTLPRRALIGELVILRNIVQMADAGSKRSTELRFSCGEDDVPAMYSCMA